MSSEGFFSTISFASSFADSAVISVSCVPFPSSSNSSLSSSSTVFLSSFVSSCSSFWSFASSLSSSKSTDSLSSFISSLSSPSVGFDSAFPPLPFSAVLRTVESPFSSGFGSAYELGCAVTSFSPTVLPFVVLSSITSMVAASVPLLSSTLFSSSALTASSAEGFAPTSLLDSSASSSSFTSSDCFPPEVPFWAGAAFSSLDFLSASSPSLALLSASRFKVFPPLLGDAGITAVFAAATFLALSSISTCISLALATRSL
mmetsp:Transcript_28509/g.78309  ORF Transcript_28509/g.78309 Transcript_28509/m.78309 type:complete len:259 (+) Transcript_28509:3505-4281(+)